MVALPTPLLVLWTFALLVFVGAVIVAVLHWPRAHRIGERLAIVLVASGLTVVWVYPGLVAILAVALIALRRRLRSGHH